MSAQPVPGLKASLLSSAFVALPVTGLALAVAASAAGALAGFGSRWGWWNFRTGFVFLKWAAYGGIAAVVVSIAGGVAAWRGTLQYKIILSLAGLLIGLVVAGIPWSWMRTAHRVPGIHDITTDTNNPPPFIAVIPLRRGAANPAEYGGQAIASQQLKAYPDIAPRMLPIRPHQAFEKALSAARNMGWQVVDARKEAGRIEATDTTFWFGFKDDVVIRITRAPGGSRVDVRSLSREGSSDVGTNAKRIREYFRELDRTGR